MKLSKWLEAVVRANLSIIIATLLATFVLGAFSLVLNFILAYCILGCIYNTLEIKKRLENESK